MGRPQQPESRLALADAVELARVASAELKLIAFEAAHT